MLVLRLYNACLLLASAPFSIFNATQSWGNPYSCTARGELISSCLTPGSQGLGGVVVLVGRWRPGRPVWPLYLF